jgi:hypothetical protein
MSVVKIRKQKIPAGLVLVTYGGGVNTVANLVLLRRLGVIPKAIVMADPGSEWPETIAYRDGPMREWCAASGFPPITVVTRMEMLSTRKGGKNYETLAGLCERTKSLPSIAYGPKKCSWNAKAAPSRWFIETQEWAQAEWAAGRQIVKCIGYDADEEARVRPGFNDPVENRQYVPWYPLFVAGIDRDGCEALILDEGLALPHKSACRFCPSNTLAEWEELRDVHPAHFAEAVEMSRRAVETIESPDVVGLMRCNPKGRRQLHVWVDQGFPKGGGRETSMPCECAL